MKSDDIIRFYRTAVEQATKQQEEQGDLTPVERRSHELAERIKTLLLGPKDDKTKHRKRRQKLKPAPRPRR